MGNDSDISISEFPLNVLVINVLLRHIHINEISPAKAI